MCIYIHTIIIIEKYLIKIINGRKMVGRKFHLFACFRKINKICQFMNFVLSLLCLK